MIDRRLRYNIPKFVVQNWVRPIKNGVIAERALPWTKTNQQFHTDMANEKANRLRVKEGWAHLECLPWMFTKFVKCTNVKSALELTFRHIKETRIHPTCMNAKTHSK